MRAEEVLGMLDEAVLEFLCTETKADYKVHKLKGSVLFKLLVYSLLTNQQTSLRVLEGVFHSYRFKAASGIALHTQTRYNSIRDRLATIPSLYFKKLFEHSVNIYSKVLRSEQHLLRYDSTMVAISAQLLHFGIKAGEKTDKKQIKFTIGFDGLRPRTAKAFTEKKYTSENIALAEAILETSFSREAIVVFDRGLQNRQKLCTMDESGLWFVTRLKTDARFEVISSHKVNDQDTLASVSIITDERVYLFDRSGKILHPFRLIRARLKKTQAPIWFLTNISTIDADQIATIYKKRWDIEVFFRFLKQELNFSHILVRTVNAIEVMLYTTLITAILLMVYRKANGLKGYKLLKLRFAQELEEDLIRQVVLRCGGDSSKIYNTS